MKGKFVRLIVIFLMCCCWVFSECEIVLSVEVVFFLFLAILDFLFNLGCSEFDGVDDLVFFELVLFVEICV